MAKQLTVCKLPSEELSYTNCAIVNSREYDKVNGRYEVVIVDLNINFIHFLVGFFRHVEVNNSPGSSDKYLFTLRGDNNVPLGQIAFGLVSVRKNLNF